MKSLVIVILSILALWIAVPTNAQDGSSNRQATPTEYLEPVTLVQLAYQGYFVEQGIPSYAARKTAIATGEVDAETLVRSALNKGRLWDDRLNDDGYLNLVRTQLENLNDR